jgi:hypothetical protein
VTEQPETPAAEPTADGAAGQPTVEQAASWVPQAPSGEGTAGPAALGDRPEMAVGAAFAGGFLAALILKRLAR